MIRLSSAGTFEEGNSLWDIQVVRCACLIGLENLEWGSLENFGPTLMFYSELVLEDDR